MMKISIHQLTFKKQSTNDLIELINAYEEGLIHENKEFIYKKVKKIQK